MQKNSREISVHIISEIYNDKSFEDAINDNQNYVKLDDRDKSLVRMITLTFFRRNGEVNHVIKKYLKKSVDKKIMNILRVGATQILFLNIPHYSVVNTSVNLSKKKIYKLSGLVNAILRKISMDKEKLINELDPIMNLPDWIKIDWIKSYGEEKTRKFARIFSKKPSLDINIKEKKFSERNWEEHLDGEKIYKQVIRLNRNGLVTDFPFFDRGDWWVQSASASIPVEIINEFFKKDIKEKIKVLEVGAAPGGKTFQLCDNNYDLTAIDISKKRIKKLEENLKRLNFSPKIINADILEFKTNKIFDCVLIDSPCSASGIVSRNPDILLRNKKDLLKGLLHKQMQILVKCSSLLKVEGIMVYVVCSLISDEGKNQIKYFLKKNKGFKMKKVSKNILNGLKYKLTDGMLTINPDDYENIGGMDGFFIACIEKTDI